MMTKTDEMGLFKRKSLDQITSIPDEIISVYVIENHIWSNGGSEEARSTRSPEFRTIDEFLINPVRSLLTDFFRKLSAPYNPERKDNQIGQGYWIQAEFGSGKSHLLSFMGALALGKEESWQIIKEKEQTQGLGRRESLYYFYEQGLSKKIHQTKGILVAVKTLVGQGGGPIGIQGGEKKLTEYILDAVSEQFYLETGRSLPIYPTEILAQRFLNTRDFEMYRNELAAFLKDTRYFDEEEQEEITDFLENLQNNPDPGVQRDCGQRLWDFYVTYLQTTPKIPLETEDVLKHMVDRLLEEGYDGLLLILDEVSLFMKGRSADQRAEDEKTLVVLSNRLAYKENLPVWTVCAAQQAIEQTMSGIMNIHARERLDLIPLLNDHSDYYDIALSRVRDVTNAAAVDQYYEDYKGSFSWLQAQGIDQFRRFFPFYPPSLDVVRQISMHLTTVRSALYFMLQTLKTQRKRKSRELISLWGLFDDVIQYEEDPSGTTKGITSVKIKWPNEWTAYENAKLQLDSATHGQLKVYRSRSEKVIKSLFLYHVANMAPGGLSSEDLMNSVMEWKDHDQDQAADLQDNLDHYEVLSDTIATELPQVIKSGPNYKFNPTASGVNPLEQFQRARSEAETNEVLRERAWKYLLALEKWEVRSQLMIIDLSQGIQSIFRHIAPDQQEQIIIKWHNREISGRLFMRDLRYTAEHNSLLPSINSAETGLDFLVFISSTPAGDQLDTLVTSKKDPRILFWTPDELNASEKGLLIDFTAYQILARDFAGRDTQDAKIVLDWVQNRLRDQMGMIYQIIPQAYSRGRITALDHTQMEFNVQGELSAILSPLITQILDDTYICKEITFNAPAPFNDTNAINVINGIVKVGEIPRGAKPNRFISAAQNYGFDLQIMRPPNDKKLDLRDCRYTKDISAWIESKLIDSSATMSITTIEKNFMGIAGTRGINYGLSRRMLQLYVLCLAREGKIRITLKGHNIPCEAIDYRNIAEIDFKTSTLDAFDQIQRLKPPKGWDILAPYAAILLYDENLLTIQEDAEIQNALQQLLTFKKEQQLSIENFRKDLQDLFDELAQPNPIDEQLQKWEIFLSEYIDPNEPIPYFRNALAKAFGYHCYAEDTVHQSDLDDLKLLTETIQQARSFFQHKDQLSAISRYLKIELPKNPTFYQIQISFDQTQKSMQDFLPFIKNEAQLRSQLLDPMKAAISSYGTRYLQVFDQVVSRSGEARQSIQALVNSPIYLTLQRLGTVKALGIDPIPAVDDLFQSYNQDNSPLFPDEIKRADIERQLRQMPQPPNCPLTFTNAQDWLQSADQAVEECYKALNDALAEKARSLHNQAVRQRLHQGKHEAFIAKILAAQNIEQIGEILLEALCCEELPNPNPIDLLSRYLKKIRVIQVSLSDFKPSKRTIELNEIDIIAQEFKQYLLEKFNTDDEEIFIIELE
jgi:hypothetical protein